MRTSCTPVARWWGDRAEITSRVRYAVALTAADRPDIYPLLHCIIAYLHYSFPMSFRTSKRLTWTGIWGRLREVLCLNTYLATKRRASMPSSCGPIGSHQNWNLNKHALGIPLGSHFLLLSAVGLASVISWIPLIQGEKMIRRIFLLNVSDWEWLSQANTSSQSSCQPAQIRGRGRYP